MSMQEANVITLIITQDGDLGFVCQVNEGGQFRLRLPEKGAQSSNPELALSSIAYSPRATFGEVGDRRQTALVNLVKGLDVMEGDLQGMRVKVAKKGTRVKIFGTVESVQRTKVNKVTITSDSSVEDISRQVEGLLQDRLRHEVSQSSTSDLTSREETVEVKLVLRTSLGVEVIDHEDIDEIIAVPEEYIYEGYASKAGKFIMYFQGLLSTSLSTTLTDQFLSQKLTISPRGWNGFEFQGEEVWFTKEPLEDETWEFPRYELKMPKFSVVDNSTLLVFSSPVNNVRRLKTLSFNQVRTNASKSSQNLLFDVTSGIELVLGKPALFVSGFNSIGTYKGTEFEISGWQLDGSSLSIGAAGITELTHDSQYAFRQEKVSVGGLFVKFEGDPSDPTSLSVQLREGREERRSIGLEKLGLAQGDRFVVTGFGGAFLGIRSSGISQIEGGDEYEVTDTKETIYFSFASDVGSNQWQDIVISDGKAMPRIKFAVLAGLALNSYFETSEEKKWVARFKSAWEIHQDDTSEARKRLRELYKQDTTDWVAFSAELEEHLQDLTDFDAMERPAQELIKLIVKYGRVGQ
jgi:hypothetical protein